MDLEIDGRVLHLRERAGAGEVVLLLHGWSTTSMVWQPVLDRWQGDERLLALDLRGCGFSDKPATGYTVDDHARDVAGVVAALARPLVLVGHSFGGAIAQRVAVERAPLVRRLVLVSPVPASGVPVTEEQRAGLRALAGRRDGFASILGRMMAKGTCEGFDALLEASASVCPAAFLEGLDAFADANFADRLGDIAVPVHVMAGALEAPLTPAMLREQVAGRIAAATFEELPEVAHYPQWEAPDAFVAALARAVRA